MSTIKTGNATHDNKVNVAESVRQAAVVAAIVAGGSAAVVKKAVADADTTFYQAAAISAAANSCSPAQYMTALRELGRTLYV